MRLAAARPTNRDYIGGILQERAALESLDLSADGCIKPRELDCLEALLLGQSRSPTHAFGAPMSSAFQFSHHQLIEKRLMGEFVLGRPQRPLTEHLRNRRKTQNMKQFSQIGLPVSHERLRR